MVARYPERIAVKTPNHSLTYDELNKAANRVARSILALIGDAEEPVALLVQHGPFVIVGILGDFEGGKDIRVAGSRIARCTGSPNAGGFPGKTAPHRHDASFPSAGVGKRKTKGS